VSARWCDNLLETKELALQEACSHDSAGNTVLSQGPGQKLTAADIFRLVWEKRSLTISC